MPTNAGPKDALLKQNKQLILVQAENFGLWVRDRRGQRRKCRGRRSEGLLPRPTSPQRTHSRLSPHIAAIPNPHYSCWHALVTRLNLTGEILYSTYLGGTGYERANGIAADAYGNAWVTGESGDASGQVCRRP